MNDEQLMRRALRLAARGRGQTSPNPMVGALVVRGEEIIASAFHQRAGAEHAEAAALRAAGDAARGATLVVTLEPCAHEGRTPPCADAVVASGVSRVVVAMEDPDPRTRGRGIARLRETGIAVAVGIGDADARELNRAYAHHRTSGRPYVTLKLALSLDGAVAPRPGERYQLSGDDAREWLRARRFETDAVMVGVGTVLVDDPLLTVRPRKRRAVPYTRIVVDSSVRLTPALKLFREKEKNAQILVATVAASEERMQQTLKKTTAEVLACRADERGRVDLGDLLDKLGSRDLLWVLCEGGPTLASELLRRDHVQEAHWLYAPEIIATRQRVPAVAPDTDLTARMALHAVTQLGADALVTTRAKS